MAVEAFFGDESSEQPTVHVLHWDQRLLTAGDFQPSQRLIVEALRQRQSVLHVWTGTGAAEPDSSESFTASGDLDWAFCVPVVEKPGTQPIQAGWARALPQEYPLGTFERPLADFVLVSAGFDGHRDDPLGGLRLSDDDFATLARLVRAVADERCGGRLVATLEGGYDLAALGRSVAAVLRVFMA